MPLPQCVNLRELFGDRYVVRYEESYRHDLGRGCERGDPWLQIIPCVGSRGHIFPWGGDRLAAAVDKPRLIKPLLALGCDLVQDGDDGGIVIFAFCDFPEVAAIVRPKRRRRLSAEQRERNAARLRVYRENATTEAGADLRRKQPHGRRGKTRQPAERPRPTRAAKSRRPSSVGQGEA